MNSRHYYNMSFTATLPTVSVVRRRVLGLLIIVVIILLLTGAVGGCEGTGEYRPVV